MGAGEYGGGEGGGGGGQGGDGGEEGGTEGVSRTNQSCSPSLLAEWWTW